MPVLVRSVAGWPLTVTVGLVERASVATKPRVMVLPRGAGEGEAVMPPKPGTL
jgi:hypothetical protein